MSVGPMNSIAGAAGAPLAQTRGADNDRAADETNKAQATDKLQGRSEVDAGVDENQQAGDRDGDGRTLHRKDPQQQQEAPDESESPDQSDVREAVPGAKDPTGTRGNRLDIEG